MESLWEWQKEQMPHNLVVAEADQEIHKHVWGTTILAIAIQAHVNLHVTDWVTTQLEDPILKTMIEWISSQKVQDLKHLLGDDANTEDGKTILSEQRKLMLYQGTLYHCHTPTGKLEEVLQFTVPMAYLSSCHEWMSLTCWTPRWPVKFVLDTWLVLVAWNGHKDTEGNQLLWVMCPAWGHSYQSPSVTHHCCCSLGVATYRLHKHWDNYGVGPTPKCGECLVLCDHFTKHVMAYVTHDQIAKTVAKFLWQGYILIFGAPARLLSDWRANFESNIIREICELMGIWKVRTSPYHAQTNGQVEWAHHTLMCMIGKLSKDQKVDWPRNLPELVHAYNSTRSVITGYSIHYLMFRFWLCLPIAFISPW